MLRYTTVSKLFLARSGPSYLGMNTLLKNAIAHSRKGKYSAALNSTQQKEHTSLYDDIQSTVESQNTNRASSRIIEERRKEFIRTQEQAGTGRVNGEGNQAAY